MSTTPFVIDNVLSLDEVATARRVLEGATWEPGTKTAGPLAASVKNNLQAASTSTVIVLRTRIAALLKLNPIFNAFVRPQRLEIMFSLYREGAFYGVHVDNAMMGEVRRDVSFTLALSGSPEHYAGGELNIEAPLSDMNYSLPPGSMVVYPATSLHSVKPVTRGERLVVVGWARSYLRDPAQRELLFELDLARQALVAQHGKTSEIDLLTKCSANLMRMWMND